VEHSGARQDSRAAPASCCCIFWMNDSQTG
jgi:hypothetical protein